MCLSLHLPERTFADLRRHSRFIDVMTCAYYVRNLSTTVCHLLLQCWRDITVCWRDIHALGVCLFTGMLRPPSKQRVLAHAARLARVPRRNHCLRRDHGLEHPACTWRDLLQGSVRLANYLDASAASAETRVQHQKTGVGIRRLMTAMLRGLTSGCQPARLNTVMPRGSDKLYTALLCPTWYRGPSSMLPLLFLPVLQFVRP